MDGKQSPKPTPHNKPGPEPERLKIDTKWDDAAEIAVNKPKPTKGWPQADENRGRSHG